MPVEAKLQDTAMARVFFALWPDETIRFELSRAGVALHECYGGRRMRPDSLHLTLVFVGQVAAGRLPELMAMAGDIRVPRFDLAFDVAECWRHNHIGCLGVSRTHEELLSLVNALEVGLQALGIAFDRRPYKPHITLLRNAACSKSNEGRNKENPAPVPVFWPARDFVLIKSSLRPDGARYEELGRWPLL